MLNLLPKVSVAIATVALGAAAIATSQAQASIVTYDFTVNVTQGSLAGQSYSGTFSYDDSTLKGTGVEKLGVDRGLRGCMNYFGRNYTEASDRDCPKLPRTLTGCLKSKVHERVRALPVPSHCCYLISGSAKGISK